jgi:sugar phosphate permease
MNHEAVLAWDAITGWVRLKTKAPFEGDGALLCWIPTERRGGAHAIWNTTLVLGATSGAITILDFSDMLASFNAASAR